jgi:hypothetical protein
MRSSLTRSVCRPLGWEVRSCLMPRAYPTSSGSSSTTGTNRRCRSSSHLRRRASGSACGNANRSLYERCGTQVTVRSSDRAHRTPSCWRGPWRSRRRWRTRSPVCRRHGAAIKARVLAAIGDSTSPPSEDRVAAFEEFGHVLVASPIRAGTLTTTCVRGRGLCRWSGRAHRAEPCPHLPRRSRRSARFVDSLAVGRLGDDRKDRAECTNARAPVRGAPHALCDPAHRLVREVAAGPQGACRPRARRSVVAKRLAARAGTAVS